MDKHEITVFHAVPLLEINPWTKRSDVIGQHCPREVKYKPYYVNILVAIVKNK